jgi:hypothetical protein
MSQPFHLHGGTYKSADGKLWRFDIHYQPERKAGIRQWIRHALANGGRAAKADGALTIEVKPA